MKKLMLSSMILLPLILLLILSLSTAFVSMTTYIYVEKIEILDSEETIYLYKESADAAPTFDIETNIFPMFASNRKIIYSSQDENVATISDKGVVTGIDFGETYIKVEAEENKAKYATRKVVVTDDEVHEIKIDETISELYAGETFQLNCTVIPNRANDKTLIFSSSNPSVADISTLGKITAKAYGKTEIKVQSNSNPEVFVKFELSVIEKLVNVTLDGDTSMELLEYPTAKFPTVVLHPANAEAVIEYSSSDENTAVVDTNGNITFLMGGSVIITATINDEYVFNKEYRFTSGYVENVTINSKSEYKFEDYIGKPLDITIDTLPKNIETKNLTVSFSNDKVLYMEEDKKFYIKGGGSVVVTVTYKTSETETKTISKTIKVTRKVEDIILNNVDGLKGKVFYSFENVFKINSNVNPADSTYDVTYSTTTPGVQIQGNRISFPQTDYLEATITASTNDGELTKDFKVIYAKPSKNRLETFEVKQGVNNFTITLPKSIYEQKIGALFYVVKDNLEKIEIIDGADIFNATTLTDIGNKQYKVKVNDVEYATINFEIKRLVERIDNVTCTEKVTGDSVITKGDMLYTSQKDVVISYDLYPLNTTAKSATIYVKEGSKATVSSNVLTFHEAGLVNVVINADDVINTFKIYSTFTHPDKDTEINSNIVVSKGDKINFSDIVTKISPSNADNKYIQMSTLSSNLKSVEGGFEALHGGDGLIKVNIETDSETITKNVSVKVLENADSIKLNKNYFVVNTNSYTIDNKDFDILPNTANNGLKETISADKGVVNGNTVTFTGSGLVKITITLESGISKVMFVLFAGQTKVVDFNNDVVELELGTKFIARLSESESIKYDGVTNINGLTYNDGIFTVSKAVNSESELSSASFTVSEKTYKVKGIIKSKGFELVPTNSKDCDKVSSGYVTALDSINLSVNYTNHDATYKGVTYSSLNKDIASVSETGIVTFLKSGEVTITATSNKYTEISSSIIIRSTMGLVDYIDVQVNDISLDYDGVKSIDLTDGIKVFPSQASKDNILLTINNAKAKVDGLTITALEGGNALVSVKYKLSDGTYKLASTIPLSISRKATGISVNDEILAGDKTETVTTAYVNLKVKAIPSDANKDNIVTVEIISGNENAFIQNGILTFLKNGEVKIKLTLNSACSYVITYNSTGDLTTAINVDDDIIVVPYELPVKFVSLSGASFVVPEDIFTKVSGSVDKYQANKSTKATMEVNGLPKTLVVTKNIDKTDIFVYDYNNTLKQEEKIQLLDKMFLTASSKFRIEVGLIDAYNADGTKVDAVLNIQNQDVATIEGGYIVFKKTDIARVEATINGIDYFGPYTRKHVFEVASTMGTAVEYKVNAPTNLVDTYNFTLKDQIEVSLPQYGGNNVNIEIASNDVFKIIGLDVEVLKTGNGELIVTSNGRNKSVINIKVDKSVDEIVFNHLDKVIVADYTNSNTYLVQAVLKANKFNPTLTNLTYKVISGDATISGNKLIFTKDYQIVVVEVLAESGVKANLTIVKVQSDVTIVDIVDNKEIVVNNTSKYVFDIIGKTFTNVVPVQSNITIVNDLTGTIKFNHGGKASYELNGQKVDFIITENVDKVEVNVNDLLTAKTTIDLNATLKPTIVPETAYSKVGAYKVEYSVIEGSAKIEKGILTFTNNGIVKIAVTAQDKSTIVTIESTMGYVKSITFDKSYEGNFIDKSIDFNGINILPSDVDSSMYSFEVEDSTIASINENKITFIHAGKTNIIASFKIDKDKVETASTELMVHNPVGAINFRYKDSNVNKIIVNDPEYMLEYIIDDSNASSYTINFIGDSVASVDEKGLVKFAKVNEVAHISIEITNSDGSVVTKTIELMTTDRIIKEFTDKYQETDVCELEFIDEYVLYGLPINEKDITYEVIDGSDIIQVVGGFVTILKGGKAIVKISSTEYTKEVNIYVHKQTLGIKVPNAVDGNIFTSNKVVDLTASILPSDSETNKDVTYEVDSTFASISNSTLTFTKAGTVKVTIAVKYNGKVEIKEVITVRSTFGEIESFEVVDESGKLNSLYDFEDIGISKKFSIVNVKPSDFDISSYIIDTQGINALSVSRNNNEFTLTSIDRGNGSINVSIGGVIVIINYDARLKIKTIEPTLNNINVLNGNEYLTMEDELTLKYLFNPANANNPLITWTIDNGATLDTVTGKITLKEYATYTLKGVSADGGCTFTVVIKKINTLDEFTLKYGNNEVSSKTGAILEVNPAYNEATLTLQIAGLPSNFIGELDSSIVTVTVTDGLTYSVLGSEVTISIPIYSDASPMFNGKATVTIGDSLIETKIYRDGIKEINFVGHDNNKDIEYGLQQVRLFGTRSYYNGQLVSYYDVPFNVLPANLGISPILKTSDPRVTASIVNGMIRVDFGNFVGNTNTDIQRNNFDKAVTVTASDSSGKINYSYVFHMVGNGQNNNVVNVFDQQGFLLNEKVVLHVSLGGTEEQSFEKYAPFTYNKNINDNDPGVNNPANKTIYGNGNTINFYAYNDTFVENKDNKQDRYQIKIQEIYNLKTKGGNMDKKKKNYNIFFSGVRQAHYCVISQGFRGLRSEGDSTFKNCSFRYLLQTAIMTTSWASPKIFVENILLVDGGFACMDLLCEHVYIKGFIDSYNYQNADGMSTILPVLPDGIGDMLAGIVIKDFKKHHKEFGLQVGSGLKADDYLNTVIFIDRSVAKRFFDIKFWDESVGDYVTNPMPEGSLQVEIGTQSAAPGLTRLRSNTGIKLPGVSYSLADFGDICTYKPDSKFSWEHQNDFEYLAKQEQKVYRTYDGSLA